LCRTVRLDRCRLSRRVRWGFQLGSDRSLQCTAVTAMGARCRELGSAAAVEIACRRCLTIEFAIIIQGRPCDA